MLENDRYAGKKRKKPAQKHKPVSDVTKSNPSKRHRDRLNGELERLTTMLPFSENVCSRLDKLSVLRLSVGYLKVKSFFNATMKKNCLEFPTGNGPGVNEIGTSGFSEGDLLLQALNGFVLVVTAEGYVFYASPTVQDYLGFHQSDMVHQSVFEFIHIDDRPMFRRQLHFALKPNLLDADNGEDGAENSSDITKNVVSYDPQHIPPENSSFLERSFTCRFRCLLDNSSGFLKLSFQGRLKFLLGQQKKAEDGSVLQPQLALFAIATPVQPSAILEIRTKTLIFQTKHKLDFTPLGIDSRGKVVLGYTEMELCMRGSGYQFIHAADMMYCADNHVRMIKTGESGMTVFRLLTKNGGWVWVQANARLVYKGGRPDFIIARQRALVNAEGEEHLRQRKMQIPFSFTTGEAVLYDTCPTLDIINPKSNNNDLIVQDGLDRKPLDPSSILASMQRQDKSIYKQPNEHEFFVDDAFRDSWALFNVPSHSVKEETSKEDAVTSMIETLEQLAQNGDLCTALQQMDVDSMELKEWENALLRMTKEGDGDKGFNLDEILANDIFSYVEEALYETNKCPPLAQPSDPVATKTDPFAGSPGQFPMDTHSGYGFAGQKFDNRAAKLNPKPHNHNGIGGQPMVTPMSATEVFNGVLHANPHASIRGYGAPGQPDSASERLSHANPNTPIPGPSIPRYSDAMPPSNLLNHFPNTEQTGPYTYGNKAGFAQTLNSLGQHSIPNIFTAIPSNGWRQPENLQNGSDSDTKVPSPSAVPCQFASYPLSQMKSLQLNRAENGYSQVNQLHSSSLSTGNHSATLSPCKNRVSPDINAHCPNFGQQIQMHTSPQWHQTSPGQTCSRPVRSRPEPEGYYQSPNPSGFPMGTCLPEESGSCNVECKNLNNDAYHSPQSRLASDQSSPLSSCMFEAYSPPNANSIQLQPQVRAVTVSSCSSKTIPNNQSPQQASCYFQWTRNEPVVGTSSVPQEDSCVSPPSCQVIGDGIALASNQSSFQRYLDCNGHTQVENLPVKDVSSFSCPPLVNGLYLSENNKANCCKL